MGTALNYDLEKSRRYIDMMQKVEDALIDKPELLGDEEQLIIECHALSVAIENEIGLIHNFIREKYGLKVGGELDAHPIDYARAVKRIDLNSVVGDLGGVLPSDSDIIVVFACWLLGKTIEACDRVLALDSAKKKVMDFVESRIAYVAPNLCALVGSAVAAQLVNTAGGVSRLGKIHSSCVLHFGVKRKKISAAQFQFPFRDLGAARMDSRRAYPTGEYGTILKERIIQIATKFSYMIFLQ
ncbi:hypothetical protein HAX54_045548 [Datura stramonium]|uniref:Nop domain-containing protein n=1 Tax=Datura stramonium TaxID=4076 RepID=A0ABS8WJV5_DATST|nr:hypothetical protein [Datura stramonium]